MNYKVIWDTEGQQVDLPSIVKVPVDIPADEAADWLSDTYGWFVSKLEEV